MSKSQHAVERANVPERAITRVPLDSSSRSRVSHSTSHGVGRIDSTSHGVGRIDLSTFLVPPESGPVDAGGETMGAGRVLILLSQSEVADVIAYALKAAGFAVQVKTDWAEGVTDVNRFVRDVVLLDSQAPEFMGTTIVRRLRKHEKENHRSAVITLIRNDADIDPTLGLEFYPCDFVLLPVDVRDLALRMDVIVRTRRGRKVTANAEGRRRYIVGPLELDVDAYYVLVNGVEVHVSTLEMRLLSCLIEHRGRVRSRKELLEDVWQYNSNVSTRTSDTHINRLRTKLGPAGALIETVRGMGYRLSGDYPVILKD